MRVITNTMIDPLPLVMYAVDKAREGGLVLSIAMSGKTLRDITLSDSIDVALEQRGWKQTKPHVIDKSIMEFIIGADIVIVDGLEGINIKTEKETEFKFSN